MRIAVSADEDTGVARAVLDQLRARGHEPIPRGALAAGDRPDWAWAARQRPPTWPTAEPTPRSSVAGPGPEPRSLPTRCRASGPRSAATRRPRPVPAGGTMRTCWRCPCGRPRRRCSPRSWTPGSNRPHHRTSGPGQCRAPRRDRHLTRCSISGGRSAGDPVRPPQRAGRPPGARVGRAVGRPADRRLRPGSRRRARPWHGTLVGATVVASVGSPGRPLRRHLCRRAVPASECGGGGGDGHRSGTTLGLRTAWSGRCSRSSTQSIGEPWCRTFVRPPRPRDVGRRRTGIAVAAGTPLRAGSRACSTGTPPTGRPCLRRGRLEFPATELTPICRPTWRGSAGAVAPPPRAGGTAGPEVTDSRLTDPVTRRAAALAALTADPEKVDLPQRLSLFGIARLPVSQLEVLEGLAENRDVHLWLTHPSPMLWNRIAQSPPALPLRRRLDPTATVAEHALLSSLGRDARELQLVLSNVSSVVDEHLAVDRPTGTLLGALQEGLRDDRQLAADDNRLLLAPGDRSVQVHACHGPPGRSRCCARCWSGCSPTTHARAARRAGDVPGHRDVRAAHRGGVRARRRGRRRSPGAPAAGPAGRPCAGARPTRCSPSLARLLELGRQPGHRPQVLDLAALPAGAPPVRVR